MTKWYTIQKIYVKMHSTLCTNTYHDEMIYDSKDICKNALYTVY